jgi:hypothetical protein
MRGATPRNRRSIVNREINPVVAVLIIVVLAAAAAGIYFFVQRPRDTYDPKKASAAAASRGPRAYQSMTGSGGQVPSGGMPYSGGYSGGMRGYSGGMQGYSGGQPMSGGYGRR